MSRRGLITGVPLAGLAAAGKDDRTRVMVWGRVPCPGCGLPVAFLPRQRKNTCAWCQTTIRRR